MELIRFACRRCQESLAVPPAHAGKLGRCKSCRLQVRVPGGAAPRAPARRRRLPALAAVDDYEDEQEEDDDEALLERLGRIRGRLLLGLTAPVCTMAMVYGALGAEEGVERTASGKHAGLQQLMFSLGAALGPTLSLVLGGAVSAWAIHRVYVALQDMEAGGS
jgi:hypothetical protein